MAYRINNFENENRVVTQRMGNFSVIEYTKDISVAPDNAESKYYMGIMGVRKRHVVIDIDRAHSATVQAKAMQWMAGDVKSTTGLKGVGDLFGKMVKGAVTKESAVKPEYVGEGTLVLEPTYKYIILQNVEDWGNGGLVIEDGMFLACDSKVEQKIQARSSLSSAVLGNEGLFNLCLKGSGVVALESNVPFDELIEVELNNDELKIDGSYAIAWSGSLEFTVERSSKTLAGSMVNGEGFVNVYRGTGRVLMSPSTQWTHTLLSTTHN